MGRSIIVCASMGSATWEITVILCLNGQINNSLCLSELHHNGWINNSLCFSGLFVTSWIDKCVYRRLTYRPYSEGDFRSCCCPTSGTTFNLQNSLDFYMLNSISVVVTRAYLQFFRILRSISLVFNLCSRHCSFYILHVILIY